MENKYQFTSELMAFYQKCVGNPEGIYNLVYVKDGHEEAIRVYADDRNYKEICVTCDSYQGMLVDFAKFLMNPNAYEWQPESYKFPEGEVE